MNVLTAKQVADKLQVNVSYIWRLSEKDPTFPKAIHLGDPEGPTRGRVTRWVEEDVNHWLTRKLKEVQHDHENGRSGGDLHQDQGEEVEAQS